MRISGFNDLHRVVYISRETGGGSGDVAACVAEIMRVSVENNRRVDVTGALLACDGWFVQALEGRRIDVDGILQRITYDRRHAELQRIVSGPVDTRAFGTWSMCASTLSSTDTAITEVLSSGGRFEPRKLTPETALELLSIVGRLQQVHAANRNPAGADQKRFSAST